MSEHIETTQTLDRPLMGVRQYQVDDEGYLGSLTGRGDRWEPDKPRKAECDGGQFGHYRMEPMRYDSEAGEWISAHSAPDPDCGCGYYAYYDLDAHEADFGAAPRRFSFESVSTRAVVSAWGDVDLHETGFRSEWMQVEALIVGTAVHKHLGHWIDLMPAWEALAERYAVPLIEEEDAEAFCRERGEVLDSRDLAAEKREAATKTAQESLAELHISMQHMAEEMKASRNPLTTDAAWRAVREHQRNQPAFWRNAAGGDIHNG